MNGPRFGPHERAKHAIVGPPTKSWGGARAGAGRPAKHAIASEPHVVRPAIHAQQPVHVVARVVRRIGNLQRARAYRALRRALAVSLARSDFRIVQLRVLADRLELLVEADDRIALARGMQGFQVAAARSLNGAAARQGTVFPDRYRARPLATRAQVRALFVAGRTTPVGMAAIPITPLLGSTIARVRWVEREQAD